MSDSDEVTKNSKKREMDKEDDSENERYKLKYEMKKRKPIARKLDFFEITRTEDDIVVDMTKHNTKKKPTARKISDDFEQTKDDDGVNNTLPLDCSICAKPFFDPIVTICHHYFCEKCARKHHAENENCFLCNKPTLGVFNVAVEIKKRIGQEREKAKAMVKEVSEMVEKASTTVDNARDAAKNAISMIEEVDKMASAVALMAREAGESATKAVEMVKEAEATMETAKADMAKAFVVMKRVVWNV